MDTAAITTTPPSNNERVLARHIRDALVKKLPPVPVVLSDKGTVDNEDIERLCAQAGLRISGVEFRRSPCLPPNVFLWSGMAANGKHVYGKLVIHLKHNDHQLVVSAEASFLSAMNARTFRLATESGDEGVALSSNEQLDLIVVAAAQAIKELSTPSYDSEAVVRWLGHILDLAQSVNCPVTA